MDTLSFEEVSQSDTMSASSHESNGSGSGTHSSLEPIQLGAGFDAHLALLTSRPAKLELDEVNMTPLFTNSVMAQANRTASMEGGDSRGFTQFGLVGGDAEILASGDFGLGKPDPRLFYNVASPSSVFICGSQGSGKSHTLSCLLENCLMESNAGQLPRLLTGLLFHYDPFGSDVGGSPCEAAFLSSNPEVRVRVLCAPSNIATMKRVYRGLPSVQVQKLSIRDENLNTQRMLELMAIGAGDMPLYVHVVERILREMRIKQQATGVAFGYADFKKRLDEQRWVPGQRAPLEQRLDTLESFMPAGKKKQRISWTPVAGQLTIVDLSCPCVTAEMACCLFNICLSLFLEQSSEIGRVVALDEAHKYMRDSPECQVLTNSLLETIRLQRHLGVRVFISTQEPTVSTKLLDLCSVTIVHRFTSPDWLATLRQHLAGVSAACRPVVDEKESWESGSDSSWSGSLQSYPAPEVQVLRLRPNEQLLDLIVDLQVGEALVFAPTAIIGYASPTSPGLKGKYAPRSTKPGIQRLAQGMLKIRMRARVTADGGRSVFAA